MKPLVYLETSVVSYLTSRTSRDLIVAARQALTLEWWEHLHRSYRPCVSALVIAEASEGDAAAVDRRLAALEGIPAIPVTDAAKNLARRMLDGKVMPAQYPEDALHVAVCAVNGVDYLVTWNCTHLANATLRRQVDRLIEAAGYQSPVICTPQELLEG